MPAGPEGPEQFRDVSIENQAVLDDGQEGIDRREALDAIDQKEEDQDQQVLEDGGLNAYSDDSGTLLDGIGRLSSLGTDYWERSTDEPEEPLPALMQVAASVPPSTGGPLPPVPPTPPGPFPPDPPPPGPIEERDLFPYSARAVLHAQDARGIEDAGYAQYFVNARAIYDDEFVGRAWSPATGQPTVTYLGGDGAGLASFTTDALGNIIFTLDKSAIAWFDAHTDNKYIELYYKVTVNGQEYNMQVVIPIHGEFVSSEFNSLCRHATDSNELVHGEWHAGRSVDGSTSIYDVVSTNMADEMTYDGRVENATIHTGDAANGEWGADKVTVNCQVAATGGEDAEIIAKGADSEITINGDRDGLGVVVASGGGNNTIEASGDDSTIEIRNSGADGHGIDAGAGTSVVVDASGANGSVTLNVQGTAIRADGATVTVAVSGENGVADITGDTGIRTANNGKTTVDATGADGSITVTAGRNGVVADTAETTANELLADKDITVTVAGAGGLTGVGASGAVPGGKNTLTSTNGNIVISANGENNAGTGDYAHAVYGGNNTITAQNGNVTITAENSRESVAAGSHDGKTAIVAEKVTLAANGDEGAYGIKSDGGTAAAGVSVTAVEVRISSEADSVHATSAAVYAGGAAGAKNVIKAGDVLEIQADGQGQVNAVKADAGGVNDISGTAAIKVGMDACTEWDESAGPFTGITKDFSAKAVHANGGSNAFAGQEMTVDVIGHSKGPDVGSFQGLTGTNKVEVGLIGIGADNSGSNTVNMTGDLNVNVENSYQGVTSYREPYLVNGYTRYHTLAVDPSSTGIYASSNGSNKIDLGGDLNITTTGRGDSAGIMADYTGENTVTVKGHIAINGMSEDGAAYGVSASPADGSWSGPGGENTVTAGSMSVDVASEMIARGIHAARGANTVTLTDSREGYALDIASAGSVSYGIHTEGVNNNGVSSSNTITNQGTGDLRIQSGYKRFEDGTTEKAAARGDAHGISNGSQTLVDGGGRNIEVNVAGKNYVNGLYGHGGTLTVQNANLLEIQADAEHAQARIDIGTYSGAYGIQAYAGGAVVIDEVKDLRVGVNTVQTGDKPAYYSAAFASTYGKGDIFVNADSETANEIRAVVEGDSTVTTGMWLNGNAGALSRIQVGGDATKLIDFTIIGTAEENGRKSPYDGSLDYNNIAAGMYGETHSQGDPADQASYNLAKAEKVIFTVAGHNRTNAAGMWANTDAKNRVEAGEATMKVSTTGDGNAHGMYAGTYESYDKGAGTNTIVADKVTLVVESDSAGAYGMKAESGGNGYSSGTNTITSKGALEVHIKLPTGGVGMWATDGNATGNEGTNSIIGNSSAGTFDKITVEGGMYAASNGKNLIQTGSGNDVVTIQGIQGAGNTVSTGAGNDTVTIDGWLSGAGLIDSGEGNDTVRVNGSVSGGFRINAGDGDDTIILNGQVNAIALNGGAGDDTLILMAADIAQFTTRYYAWFNALTPAQILAMNIESIQVYGVDPTDAGMQWFADKVAAAGLPLTQAPGPLMAPLAASMPEAETEASILAASEGMPESGNAETPDALEDATPTMAANSDYTDYASLKSLVTEGEVLSDVENGQLGEWEQLHAMSANMHPVAIDNQVGVDSQALAEIDGAQLLFVQSGDHEDLAALLGGEAGENIPRDAEANLAESLALESQWTNLCATLEVTGPVQAEYYHGDDQSLLLQQELNAITG